MGTENPKRGRHTTRSTIEDLKDRLTEPGAEGSAPVRAALRSTLPTIRTVEEAVDSEPERTKQLLAVLAASRSVSYLVAHERDPQQLIESVCRAITMTEAYKDAWIILHDDEGRPKESAEVGCGPAFTELLELVGRGRIPECWRRASQHPGSVIIERTSDECGDCPLAPGHGRPATLTVAIEYQGHRYGLMCASLPLHRARDELERCLLEDLAGDVALWLAKIKAETERRRVERERDLLTSAVESSPDGVAITDDQGRIRSTNEAFHAISGRSASDVLGEPPDFLCALAPEAPTFADVRQSLQHSERWMRELHVPTKEGGDLVIECSASALSHERDRATAFVITLRDITERRRLESIAEAFNIANNIGHVFSGLRHELGNPINSVGSVLKLLHSKFDRLEDDAVRSYLARALDELRGMERLLWSLKSFNMYEHLRPQRVELRLFVERLVKLVARDAEGRGVKLTTEVHDDAGGCWADPRALQQVLLNVIANALDACDEAPEKRVSLTVSRHRSGICCRVRDTGVGMSAEERGHLFEMFRTTKRRGTGMGLVIARKLLNSMKGSIEISSERGEGTTVFIVVPEHPPGE